MESTRGPQMTTPPCRRAGYHRKDEFPKPCLPPPNHCFLGQYQGDFGHGSSKLGHQELARRLNRPWFHLPGPPILGFPANFDRHMVETAGSSWDPVAGASPLPSVGFARRGKLRSWPEPSPPAKRRALTGQAPSGERCANSAFVVWLRAQRFGGKASERHDKVLYEGIP